MAVKTVLLMVDMMVVYSVAEMATMKAGRLVSLSVGSTVAQMVG